MKSIVFLFLSAILFFGSCKKKDVPIDAPAFTTSTTGTTTGTPKPYGFIIAGDTQSSVKSYSNTTASPLYTVDLDSDSKAEIRLQGYGQSSLGGHYFIESVQSDYGADSVYVYADISGYPIPVLYGDTINNKMHWVALNKERILTLDSWGAPDTTDQTAGHWFDLTSKYLAFYFKKNNSTYYGWVLFQRSPWNIEAWAYRK